MKFEPRIKDGIQDVFYFLWLLTWKWQECQSLKCFITCHAVNLENYFFFSTTDNFAVLVILGFSLFKMSIRFPERLFLFISYKRKYEHIIKQKRTMINNTGLHKCVHQYVLHELRFQMSLSCRNSIDGNACTFGLTENCALFMLGFCFVLFFLINLPNSADNSVFYNPNMLSSCFYVAGLDISQELVS